jgi:MFS family permease
VRGALRGGDRGALLLSLRRVLDAQRALPQNVRALGWVSFANDVASELAYPIVPLFLRTTLGASYTIIGIIEGVAEGVAVGFRGLAGLLSDRAGERRKPWIAVGYGLTTVSRPLLALAHGWGLVLGARLADRVGKAARTAPRDALIRDSSAPHQLGSSFGYHRAMDSAGAVLGPLAAVGLLSVLHVSLRTALWVVVLPSAVALALVGAIRDVSPTEREEIAPRGRIGDLPAPFWGILAVWVLFSIGNSADVFLLLRAHQIGLGTSLTVVAYALYQLVYSGLSWPLGALSDRIPRTWILGAGLAVFGLVYLGFARPPGDWAVWPLLAVYGVYVAATDGVARAVVGDNAPAGLVGTAFGVFSAATGAALLLASVSAGLLWSKVSPSAPFYVGAAAAALAFVVLLGLPSTGYRMRRAPT